MQSEIERTTGEKMVLNFGPQHPATHGTLRIVLELDGESIVKGNTTLRIPAYRIRKTGRTLRL